MKDDAQLQALYRRYAALAAGDAPAAEDVAAALTRSGWPDEEGTPLDRIAASPAHADVLRAALALGPDAEALSRDLATLRAPRRAVARHRRWLALAAALGAVALLTSGLRDSVPTPSAPHSIGSESLLSASFESSGDEAPAGDDDVLFSADFDS
jgi:hypothetical protein